MDFRVRSEEEKLEHRPELRTQGQVGIFEPRPEVLQFSREGVPATNAERVVEDCPRGETVKCIEEQPRKVHSGPERQMKRSPEPTIHFEKVELVAPGIPAILHHRHAFPPHAAKLRQRVVSNRWVTPARAQRGRPAGVRDLVQSKVHEFREELSAMKQEKGAYAPSWSEALNDRLFEPRRQRSKDRLGFLRRFRFGDAAAVALLRVAPVHLEVERPR